MVRQFFRDLCRRRLWIVSSDNIAFTIHQEFREIPGNVFLAFSIRLGRLEHLVQIARVVAVYCYLGEHWEVDIKFAGGEFENLFVGTRFLCAELVARKRKDVETIVLIIVM